MSAALQQDWTMPAVCPKAYAVSGVQDLLARRQYLAEQRRPRDEESLQHCTGRPVISAFAHSLHRSRDDLLAWYAAAHLDCLVYKRPVLGATLYTLYTALHTLHSTDSASPHLCMDHDLYSPLLQSIGGV